MAVGVSDAMACYHPVFAFRSADGGVVFSDFGVDTVSELRLPCGKCVGCQQKLRLEKAMRLVHETRLFKHNCFVTLTYDDDHVPVDGDLDVTAMARFVKRLRRRVEPLRIRFAGCGEYGQALGRPHYHLAIFNYDFGADRYRWRAVADDPEMQVYRSPLLESCWQFGTSSLGALTRRSAAYIAGYVHKKLGAPESEYEFVNPLTGVVSRRVREFWRSSNRPGLGAEWVKRFASTDVWPHDRVVYQGKEMRPPRYYDELLKRFDRGMYDQVKAERSLRALGSAVDNTPERLLTREIVAQAAVSLRKRSNIK